MRQLRHVPLAARDLGRHGARPEAALDDRPAQARAQPELRCRARDRLLLGKQTPRVSQYGHDSLATFGIGQDVSEQEWRGVVRQLLAQGLLAVEGEYGILAITESSGTVLSGSRPVLLRREAPKRSKAAKRAVAAQLPEVALPLFEALRAWRSGEATAQGVPAYIVFGDATLRGISVTRPSTLEELGTITGVGEKKLEQYGDALLAVVAAAE